MALLEMESSSLRPDYHGVHCTYFCWLPILMGFLSLSVGICCLFSMCRIGVILGILNSIFGLIFSYITYSTLARPKRYKAIVAIVGNILHICLLLFTVIYGSRMLVLNIKAQAKNNAANASYTFNFMLDYYLAQGGYEASHSHHETQGLYATLPSSSSGQLSDSEVTLGNQTLPSSDSGVSAATLEKSAFSSLPFIHSNELLTSKNGEQNSLQDLLARQAARFRVILSAIKTTAKDVSWVNFKTRESWISTGNNIGGEAQAVQANSSTNSTTEYSCEEGEEEEPVCCPCLFSRDDLNCIVKAEKSEVFAESVLNRLRSLLYWGLFCGYVEWGLNLVSRLNRRCEECILNQFDFGRHGRNKINIEMHAAQLMQNIKAMPRKQTRFCASKAVVASCRMEETMAQRGAAAALCAALPLSFVLFMFCLTCIVACWKIAQKYGAKVQNT